jgi:RNA 2',3'-cyclic 3'-phosphodiesterase
MSWLAASQIRSSFLPHVTLRYQHPPVSVRRVQPLAWEVVEFCLVVSHHGKGRHEVLARWPLHDRQIDLFG